MWQRQAIDFAPIGTPITSLRGATISGSVRGDSYETAFAARALTRVSEVVATRTLAPLPLVSLITQDNSGGEGLAQTGYNEAEASSRFKKRAPGATDAPQTVTKFKEVLQKVEPFFDMCSWTRGEMVRASLTGQPLRDVALSAMRRAYEELLQETYIYGDKEGGARYGLLNDERIKGIVAPAPLTNASTAEAIRKAMVDAINTVRVNSKTSIRPNVLLVPDTLAAKAETTNFDSTNQDDTVKLRVEKQTGVRIVAVPEFDQLDGSIAAGGENTVMIAARITPLDVRAQVPMPYTELPLYIDAMGNARLYALCELGGLEIYQPSAFYTVRNIWSGGL